MSTLTALLWMVMFCALWLAPVIVAGLRALPGRKIAGIAVLTVLLGWTMVGWIGALVWSVSEKEAS